LVKGLGGLLHAAKRDSIATNVEPGKLVARILAGFFKGNGQGSLIHTFGFSAFA
jgi:hypothetical protein